jgi:hypothetical protein
VLLWALVAALAVAVVSVATIKLWPMLQSPVSERATLNPSCSLHAGPCSVRFDSGGEVVLEIVPRAIPAVHPLQIQVTLRNMPAPQSVEVDFAGVEMDMGFNRTRLRPRLDTGVRELPRPVGDRRPEAPLARPGPLKWSGQGMLPVCVRDRMTWEARVLLQFPQRLLAAPFRFETVRPGQR